MSLRYHEIAETHHRILNPFTEPQLELLGEICRLQPSVRQLDLCCGKGEMLCRWSATYGISGVGVDLSPVFLKAARERAVELGCQDRLSFAEADAGQYSFPASSFDVASCIGATWIGKGLVGTLRLLRPALRDQRSLMLIGEPYWIDPPPDAAYACIGGDRELFTSLEGTLERFEAAGLELVEMVLADHHGWDRYEAKKWIALSDWLRANPRDPDADDFRQIHERSRRDYLTCLRRYFGWGVFVLRPR
jgi:SAM-dependent methyltransferase